MAIQGKRPGHPKTGGRVKGTPNKNTASCKEALQLAFEGIGGVPALTEWGRQDENRGEFYRIWSRIIPQEIQHTGELTLTAIITQTETAHSSAVTSDAHGHSNGDSTRIGAL